MKILIAYDGSDLADEAVADLAGGNPSGRGGAGAIRGQALELHHGGRRIGNAGLGSPHGGGEKAAAVDADCLFLGSRTLKGFQRILPGSVSGSVAVHARCTVEVHPDRPIEGE